MAQFFTHDGQANLRSCLRQMEDTLAEHDMPGTATMETMLKLPLSKGENSCQSNVFYGVGTDAAGYDYLESTPPQNAGEIALTPPSPPNWTPPSAIPSLSPFWTAPGTTWSPPCSSP